MVQVLPALVPVADEYDGFIIDLWGVLHDGLSPFPWARGTLLALKEAGKKLCLLSNAPRPAAIVAAKMRELGFQDSDWDFLMTSGQDAWEHLRTRPDAWYQALGPRYYLIGLTKDEGLVAGLRGQRVYDVAEADYLINAGIGADHRQFARQRRFQQRAEVCAGLLADFYEKQGGVVRYHGKPFPGVYTTCLGLLGGIAPDRVLAIGDGLKTDIKGANAAGIASVLITSGVHGEAIGLESDGWFDQAALNALIDQEGATPTYVLHRFQ